MSNTKSVEQQLKEAIEASKQTLALSEQVTSLASEKETLSKRLAEIESALSAPKAESAPVAADPLIVAKLGELLAERELTAKTLSELQANVVRLEKEAAKKADLNKYVERQLEEGEEGNSPAEKQHLDAGKKKDDEACNEKAPKSKKAKKASYGEDDEEDYGNLSDDEIEMLREYRNACKAKSGKAKADSTVKAPLVEEEKEFDKVIPQPGLDPEKNCVNEDNTTSPSLSKQAKKASVKKGETDVEEIIESPDMQKKEDAEGGEENETHEKTLSTPEKGAKKAKEVSLEPEAKKAGDDEIPAPLMEYLKQLVQQEKEKKETEGKKGENALPGINKQDVVGQPDQDEEESFLNKKDSKKGKKAEDTLDAVVDVAVERLAQVAKAKKDVEVELAKKNEALASETKAKDEAFAAVAKLQAKFEAMMTKLANVEASDNALEAKAAKIVAQSVSEPVAAEIQGEGPVTDADYLAKFEAITDAREKNRYFKAHAAEIGRASQANLKRKVRS